MINWKPCGTILRLPFSTITSHPRNVFKHVNNEMFMNGSQDSDSHSPLMVYIRSRSATKQRNFERSKEYFKKKRPWTQQGYKEYNKQQWGNQKQWKDYGDSTWHDYGDYVSQSDSSYRWNR